MTVVCPEGHVSEATDWCDTCGAPIGGMPSPAAPPPSPEPVVGSVPAPAPEVPAGPATVACPHCGATNHADALFCEDCGYDFTTGAAPMGESATEEVAVEPEVEPEAEAEAEPQVDAAPQTVATPETEGAPAEPEPRLSQPEPEAAAMPVPTARHTPTPPSRPLAQAWVVEVWVDPDWYALQDTAEACPSPGVPDIVRLERSVATVGRPSSSGRPEVDAGGDSAVSRRHAQLSTDGQRWWVEDLGSSNGTFVGTVGEPLPDTPIPSGQRVEIGRDQRVYVGAWTRLALRPATGSEVAGQG